MLDEPVYVYEFIVDCAYPNWPSMVSIPLLCKRCLILWGIRLQVWLYRKPVSVSPWL